MGPTGRAVRRLSERCSSGYTGAWCGRPCAAHSGGSPLYAGPGCRRLRTAPPAGGSFGAPGTPSTWPQTRGQSGDTEAACGPTASPVATRKWVEQRLVAADGETAMYPRGLASNEMHIAPRRVLELEPRAWCTLCGWHFGVAPAGAVKRLRKATFSRASACDNCRRAAGRALIPVEGLFAEAPGASEAAGNGPPPRSAEACSSSDSMRGTSGSE